MTDDKILDIEINDEVGKFTETYSSFNKIINKIQSQYLTLKETYAEQSEELQSVNETLQSLMSENRAVSEFLDSILNSLSSGVIAVDKTGLVSHINPAAKKILGLSETNFNVDDTITYDEIMKPVDNGDCSATAAIQLGSGNVSGEKKVKTAYGTILTLSVSTSLLLNRAGEIAGAVELFQDISKLKAMEEQISQMKVLASMGEMAASIAHEVRNPLVGVGGFASLLARDLKDDPPKRKMAKKIVEGVESINSIIQTLLDFARKEKIEKVEVDLNPYLKLILEDIRKEQLNSNIDNILDYDLASNEKMITELDRRLFRQVICNLVKNGLEACSEVEQPDLKIETRIISIEEAHNNYKNKIELSGTETLAEISIKDNGPGIAKDDLEKLFSPFYSTKENGIGLGLSIAWKIIKVHGGEITAESEPGNGTKFSILLPVKSVLHGATL